MTEKEIDRRFYIAIIFIVANAMFWTGYLTGEYVFKCKQSTITNKTE